MARAGRSESNSGSAWRMSLRVFVEWMLQLGRKQKSLAIFAMDTSSCIISVLVAFSLRVGAFDFPIRHVLHYSAFAIPLFVAVFYWNGVYKTIFRYVGGKSILILAKSAAIYSVPLVILFLFIPVVAIPRTVAILQPMIFFGLLVASRILLKHLISEVILRSDPRPMLQVVIYGAGRSGQQLAGSLSHEQNFVIVAFVDDDRRLRGNKLDGVPIIHADDLPVYAEKGLVDTVLIALPKASRKRRGEIVERLRPLKLRVQTLPAMSEIVGGGVSISDVRDIQIEDLLGRDEVQPNEILFARTIFGKTVLVTGAGGSIGSEICRQIVARNVERIILFEMSEFALYKIEQELRGLGVKSNSGEELEIVAILGSVTDRNRVREVLQKWAPDTVYHAAAYKHVPLVEENQIEGLRNNIIGTKVLVDECQLSGVKDMTLISTDKAVRPTNIMGASKRVAELVVQAAASTPVATCFSIVRFGNVLGSSGSVVPLFRAQIAAGGPITLTHRNVMRYFMTIPEASQLVIQAAGLAKGGEVFILDMGQAISIYDLASSMVQLSGLSVRDAEHPNGDIEILEVGLRPGEKLREELLIEGGLKPTVHDRISMAREKQLPFSDLEPLLTLLENYGDENRALKLLKEIVPEFSHRRDDLHDNTMTGSAHAAM